MGNIKKILIVCAHERQALNGGIDIANRLQKLGHEVLFLGPNIRFLRVVAETNGFRYHGFGKTKTIAPHLHKHLLNFRYFGILQTLRRT